MNMKKFLIDMKNRNKNYWLGLLLFSCCVIGCKKEVLNANGRLITETRFPGHFTHIHTSGGSPVVIDYGPEYKVELKGSENLIAKYQTAIHGDELTVGYQHLELGKDDIRVYITLPKPRKVSLSGSSIIALSGFTYLPLLAIDISGSGEIKLNDAMEVERANVNISGSGNASLLELRSEKAEFTISGSGNVRTGITERLKATISGSGSIYYQGNPLMETSITGTGRVMKMP